MTKGQLWNLMWVPIILLAAILWTVAALIQSVLLFIVSLIWIVAYAFLMAIFEPGPKSRNDQLSRS